MIETCPKTRNATVGDCPECGAPMFEEVQETGDYHPDHERIYYVKYIACSGCNYTEDFEESEPDYDPD
jgi:predicted nucleic-acid-binding Zn-ribbon protein